MPVIIDICGGFVLKPDPILTAIGECGRHLADIGASEGAAGNISVLLPSTMSVPKELLKESLAPTPIECPNLVGRTILVTGSGTRLREIQLDPYANLACLEILPDGREMRVRSSDRRLFEHPTSELNTHLAIHERFGSECLEFPHTVIHAQPLYLTYLSHIARYQETNYLNRHIMRWQAETVIFVPEGVGVLPFLPPGSSQLQAATLSQMEVHRVVLWGKHGVIARSNGSIKKAADLIEYVEVGARYEYLNLSNHGLADGLTSSEIKAVCAKQGLQPTWLV